MVSSPSPPNAIIHLGSLGIAVTSPCETPALHTNATTSNLIRIAAAGRRAAAASAAAPGVLMVLLVAVAAGGVEAA
jgi:hypothetical protein